MTNSTQFSVLSNGLTVHLKEMHTAPIISSWLWYKVGSRNEVPGKTGISHWVEHMQFKGTEKFPSGYLDREISKVGGILNAMTYLDWTTFYMTLPAHAFDISLAVEADRMDNSRFDLGEVERERMVIISEREGNENEPRFLLSEAVQDAAFSKHTYKHEVIGVKDDLLNLSAEDLKDHYQNYYRPGNAVLAIAGDFKTENMLEKVGFHFNHVQPHKEKFVEIPQEPPLDGEKRVQVTGPGETSYVQIAYRAPGASNKDFFSLTVLDSLLTGPSSLNMFGAGGTSNKTSRLYRALVEEEISVSCHGGLQATRDPYLYQIHLTVHPHHTPDELLAAVDREIDRLLETSISQEEIDRAIKQARALFAYSSENISNQAFWLGYTEMFDSYDWFENYVDHLSQITPEIALETARSYLKPENRVVGFYTPEES